MSLKICLVSPYLECIVYTVSRALSDAGHTVNVLSFPKTEGKHFSHEFYFQRLSKLNNVCLFNSISQDYWDWTYFILMPEVWKITNISSLIKRSNKIGIISMCHKSSYIHTLWHEFKEILNYWPCAIYSKSVIFTQGYYTYDLYSIFSHKNSLGFDVHSNFFDDLSLRNKMFSFSWKTEDIRKYKFNYIGNKKPEHRQSILNSIKNLLDFLQKSEPGIEHKYLWVEYGDNPGEIRGVSPDYYIDHLTQSDFTLCPPGYSKITHRVVEALVRGSIPILHEEELELYSMDLKNQVNCIAVKNNDWVETIKNIIKIDISQIREIRQNILNMRHTFTSDHAISKSLTQRLLIQ